MQDEDQALETLAALTGKYTHLMGTLEGNSPFVLLNLAAGEAQKPDRQEGIPRSVFEILWHSGWIELELQATDLNKRLYRISARGRAQMNRFESAGDGAGI